MTNKKIPIIITIVLAAVMIFSSNSYNGAEKETTRLAVTTKKTEVPTTTKKEAKKKKTKKKKVVKKKKKKVIKKKIIKKKVKFKKKWKYAKYSKIHSGKSVLYKHNWGKNRKVIAINAGHGTRGGERRKTLSHPNGTPKLVSGSTPRGAKYSISISSGMSFGNGKSEASATLSLAKILRKRLLRAGYDVLMIRTKKDVQLDNIARTVIANKYADCHISLHYDSTRNNKGAFFISVPKIRSYRNMMPVKKYWRKHNKLGKCTIWGMRKKGVRIYKNGRVPIDLTQTSYSTIPSIDVEVGDKATSTSKKTQTKVAKGIVRGIKKYYKKK